MANNNIIYNAVFTGTIAAMQRRWITSIVPGNYGTQVSQADALATLIDSVIAPSPDINDADGALMQSVVENVVSDRTFLDNAAGQSALGNAILAAWTSARTFLRSAASSGAAGEITQLAWEVDAVSGDDSNSGAPGSPLKTLRRLSQLLYLGLITQSVTVDVLTDMPEPDRLNLSVLFEGVSTTLTVQGAVTDIATFTIVTAVSAAPSAATYVWAINTTGIDWTTQTDRRIQLPGGAIGHVGTVVDANNIIVTKFLSQTGVAETPVAGSATLQRTVKMVPFAARVQPSYTNRLAVFSNLPQVIIQHFDLRSSTFENDLAVDGPLKLYGSQLVVRNGYVTHDFVCLSCLCLLLQVGGVSSSILYLTGGGSYFFNGCAFDSNRTASPAATVIQMSSFMDMTDCCLFRCGFNIADGRGLSVGGSMYVEGYIFTPFLVSRSAVISCQTGTIEGTVQAAATAAFSAKSGGKIFYNPANPLNVTGAIADTIVGTATFAYGVLPQTSASLSGILENEL